MTEINIVKTYNVPDGDIEVLIEMAGYGIGYWAMSAVVDDEARTYTVTDEDGPYVVYYDDLARVLVEVALGEHEVGYPREYAINYLQELEGEGSKYAAGEIDSDLADAIVQIAALGEIVYG